MALTLTYLYPTNVSPPLGTAVNMVKAKVNNDSSGGTVVITHNLTVSAADLALGLPNITIEPLAAGVWSTALPFIAAVAANTVSITVAAGAGNFNVVIERPSTIVR